MAESDYLIVRDIEIKGNRKTKNEAIIRELNFRQGDTIMLTNLSSRLEQNQFFILNTGLFTAAKINVREWMEDGTATIAIEVTESWYIWPIPFFELADRNFNVWWENGHSLKRANYGMYLTHNNLTGNRDRLLLVVQSGYTQKYELRYSMPYVDKKQTLGLGINLFYATNKEITYSTVNDRQQFLRIDSVNLLRRVRAGFSVSYRPDLYLNHRWYFQYHYNKIADIVAEEYNPDFLLGGRTEQRFSTLFYEITYDKRDIKPYPKNGVLIIGTFQKDGFGVFQDRNTLYLSLMTAKYFPLSKKFNLDVIVKGRTELIRKKQDYYNYYALGFYGDFIHGYEYYVIDGLDFAYLKTSLHYEVLDKKFDFSNVIPFKSFKIIPLKVYISLNNDIGYVNDPYYAAGNYLVNRPIYGTGIGLDLVLFYDKVFQIEYSINHLKEKGIYLHTRVGF